MIYFTDKELNDLLIEDVPYFDLTTSLLRLGNKPAKIQFSTAEDTVICCTEEVLHLFAKLNISPTLITPSGEYIEKSVKFLEGEGLAKNIHILWRTSEKLISFASGIATRTNMLIEKAHEINPDIAITTSSKTLPYTKRIAIKAVRAGGGSVHRLSLSESILIHKNHYSFLGKLEDLEKRIEVQKNKIAGNMVTVEVNNGEDALKIANSSVDIIMIDDMNPKEIKPLSNELKKKNPKLKIAICDEINTSNIKDYALCGADILVTSWPYYAHPVKIDVSITPIFDY